MYRTARRIADGLRRWADVRSLFHGSIAFMPDGAEPSCAVRWRRLLRGPEDDFHRWIRLTYEGVGYEERRSSRY